MPDRKIFRGGIIFFVIFLTLPHDVWAAAAAQRMQQQKAMQQKILQQQYEQQMAQKQAQEMAAYQQAIAQRQAQMQQVAVQQKAAAEYAVQKRAMQEAIAQRQAQQVAQYQQQAAAQQMQNVLAQKQAGMVKQAVAAKSQAELNQQIQEYAQFLAKRQQVVGQQAIVQQQAKTAVEMAQYHERQKMAAVQTRIAMERKIQEEMIHRRVAQQAGSLGAIQGSLPPPQQDSPAQDSVVVTIDDLWAALDRDSSAWQKVIDQEIKRLTVAEYMDRFGKQGILIRRAPGEYVKIIDTISGQNPDALQAPFMNVLSYAAIMEYDFDNGENKDALARRVLGEANFLANKKRILAR